MYGCYFPFIMRCESGILLGTGTLIHARFEDTVPFQRLAWTLSLFLTMLISGAARGQGTRPSAPPPPPQTTGPIIGDNENEAQQRLARGIAKKANLQRQAVIKADTDRLLKLAVELKDSVDKSSEDILSVDVLKKAEEIEKLAHNVKDKMKGP